MIDYPKVRHLVLPEVRQEYTARDTMLYALGLGFAADPLDARELRFVYEKDLVAVPTMAVVLGTPGPWMRQPGLGIDFLKMVHGEQGLTLHAPLPSSGAVVGRSRVTHVVDKGAGKGALVQTERTLHDAVSGELLATVQMQVFCRADGGFATPDCPGDAAPEAIPPTPGEPADMQIDIATRADAALLYRLSGDYNPLHVDPETASHAGFPRPILHGLATYGIALRALLLGPLEFDVARLRSLRARFSGPVLPGDTLRTSIWVREDRVHFRVQALEREVTVISTGVATVAAPAVRGGA
jgi:acyl dehydratase